MTTQTANLLKTFGYCVSTASVLLLGFVAWQNASEDPTMMLCLVAGMATSICGMFLRWLSYQGDQKENQGIVGQLAQPAERDHRRDRRRGSKESRPITHVSEPETSSG